MKIKYGKESLDLELRGCVPLVGKGEVVEKPEQRLRYYLKNPLGTPALMDHLKPEDSVLVVLSDPTRVVRYDIWLPILLREVEKKVPRDKITLLVGTGLHYYDESEHRGLFEEIYGPVVSDYRLLVHKPRGSDDQFSVMGITSYGTKIKVNKEVMDHSVLILTGSINFHYYAGFTGGRKAICPGISSEQTINHNHSLVFDFPRRREHPKCKPGVLSGNPVHEDMMEIASVVRPEFLVNVVVDGEGRLLNFFVGDYSYAWRRGTEYVFEVHAVPIREKADVTVVSAGGYPYDVNFYQAHKALEFAAYATKERGKIFLLAKASEMGHPRFIKYLSLKSAAKVMALAKRRFEVVAHTAYAFLKLLERFEIYVSCELEGEERAKLEEVGIGFLSPDEVDSIVSETNGLKYFIPYGNITYPYCAVEGG